MHRAAMSHLTTICGALALLASSAPASAAGAPATVAPPAGAPATAAPRSCDDAIHAFDAAYGERSDEAALTAARALAGSCPGAAGVRSSSRVAMIFYARKDYDQAIAAFQEAIRAKPDPRMYMSLCGVLSQAKRNVEALETCRAGLKLAKAADDGSPAKHANVVDLGFNVSLIWVRLQSDSCDAPAVIQGFEAFRDLHPDHAFVYQMLGAWAWDCEHDFKKGLALYEKSCALGHQPACEQVEYTKQCQCETRLAAEQE